MTDNISNKSEKKKKTKKPKKHPRLRFAIKISLLIMLLTAVIITIFLYMRYGDDIIASRQLAVELIDNSSKDTFRAAETSLVYDQSGKQIARLKGDKDMYYVSLDRIPQAAKDAMIVTEDKTFYSHKGIDLKAISAAFVSLVRNKGDIKRGGSTITQQVAKNVFLTNEVTWTRKITEMFMAFELEKKYTKDEILEFYLNNIYFAQGYYGIEAASKGYFNKSCNELSLAQIIFLCSIPNSPTRYDPIENYDNTLERKNRILDQMLSDGKITDVEYNEAYNETIKLKRPKVKKRNYVETYTMNCTVKALMKVKGFVFKNIFNSEKEQEEYNELYNDTYSECQQQLFRSGYRIYTSLDLEKQSALQRSINEQLEGDTEKNSDGIYTFQGAGVCIDNDTGKVVAAVGGRSQSSLGYTFNRAFQSYRQPGSSIKPIIVYTPYLERGHSPYDTVKDEPIEDGPKNSTGRYLGSISIKTAVEQSVNTVAWKLFEELTPEIAINYLLRMNFSKISRKDYNMASALGGLTNGVSPAEMASAYATIENSGVYREPTCIVTITDANGNVIVNDESFEEKMIYDKEAATTMTSILEGVIKNGTGRGFALDNMPCAAKTGTTNDKKDGWFAGYTPYYTTVVWVGNDIPQSRSDLLGNTYPARIWHQYMTEIHESLEYRDFDRAYEADTDSEETKEPKPTKKPKKEEDTEVDIEDNEPDDIATVAPEVPDNPADTGSEQKVPPVVDNLVPTPEPEPAPTPVPEAPEPQPEVPDPTADANASAIEPSSE